MPKYELYFDATVRIEVEAQSESEAKEKAWIKISYSHHEVDTVNSCLSISKIESKHPTSGEKQL